jgi:hypothetical protein
VGIGRQEKPGRKGGVTQYASGLGVAYFELIVGGKRQLQTPRKTAGVTRACDEVAAGCESMLGCYCPEFGTDNCIDGNPGHEFPDYNEELGGGACRYR